jgi:hypothetical protein
MIPASASARLAHDIMMGRSPEIKQLAVRSRIVQIILTKELMRKKLAQKKGSIGAIKLEMGCIFLFGTWTVNYCLRGKGSCTIVYGSKLAI